MITRNDTGSRVKFLPVLAALIVLCLAGAAALTLLMHDSAPVTAPAEQLALVRIADIDVVESRLLLHAVELGLNEPADLGRNFSRIVCRHLIDGGVANNTPISTAVDLGATRVIVLPTGMSCGLTGPPRGAVALALHALNLLIMRQLLKDIERFAGHAELVVLPPLCPLTTNTYDFSHTGELIHRAEAATRLWLRKNGLLSGGAPAELQFHHHEP